MFCPLFILDDNCKLAFHKFEKCTVDCEFYNSSFPDNCSISKKKHEKLTDEKFGWMIIDVIKFANPTSCALNKTKYTAFLLLTHPSEKDIWIAQYLNKKNVQVYSLYTDGKKLDFQDMVSLNFWIKKKGLNCRALKESDFTI